MVQVFAHRGAVSFAPENTLKAVEKALELGVYGIELDVRETKDRQLVIFHDKAFGKEVKVKGKLSQKTLEALKEIDLGGGVRIPTLEEIIGIAGGKCVLNLEVKLPKSVEAVIGMVEHYKIADKAMLSSFYKGPMRRAKEINPKIETAIITPTVLPKNPIKLLKNYKADALHIPHHKVTKKLVDELHGEGFLVRSYPWRNGSTGKEIFERLEGYGVDGVIMNEPEEVL